MFVCTKLGHWGKENGRVGLMGCLDCGITNNSELGGGSVEKQRKPNWGKREDEMNWKRRLYGS